MMIKITKIEGLVPIEGGLLDKVVMIGDSPKVYRRILNQSLGPKKTSRYLTSNSPARPRRSRKRYYSDFFPGGGNVVLLPSLRSAINQPSARCGRRHCHIHFARAAPNSMESIST